MHWNTLLVFWTFTLDHSGFSCQSLKTNSNSIRDGNQPESQQLIVKDEKGQSLQLTVYPKMLETSQVSFRIFDGRYSHSTILQSSNDCQYIGQIVNSTNSFVSINFCGSLRGIITEGQKTYKVQSDKVYKVTTREDYNQVICNTVFVSDQNNTKERPFRRRRATKEQLMIELYVVMDSALFSEAAIGSNVTNAYQYIEDVVNHVDEIYSEMDIRVLLVGIEIWKVPQSATKSSDATELLDEFLTYAKNNIRKQVSTEYDFIALLSGKIFGKSHVGMARVNAMCGDQSGAVIQDDNRSPARELKTAVVLAHEIGHVFGMLHDDAACLCPDPKDCVMAADITQLPTTFSSCSRKVIKKVRDTGRTPCLYNVPTKIHNGPICGNGIKEKGEACDCGGREKCKKSQCCTEMCQLKHHAKCDMGRCCHECEVTKAGKLCRHAQNNCDLEEYCDGKSQFCPANLYKRDLLGCGVGVEKGYCYKGQCNSNELQCKRIWGQTGKAPDVSICSVLNKRGKESGNCGSLPNNTFRKCSDRDKMCGKLFCDSSVTSPISGSGTQTVTSLSFNGVTCKGITIDLGQSNRDKFVVPRLVDDGSLCYTNIPSKTEGLCINQQCVELNKIPVRKCPTRNGTECYGQGICNNIGLCWCYHGYTGVDCSVIISYGNTPVKPLTDVHITLISIACTLAIVGISLGIIIICYRKMKKKQNKEKDHCKGENGVNVKTKTAWSYTDETKRRTLPKKIHSTKVHSIH